MGTNWTIHCGSGVIKKLRTPALEIQEAKYNSIQELLDQIKSQLEQGDLVQIHLGVGLNDPLYSMRRHRGTRIATEFMEHFSNLV